MTVTCIQNLINALFPNGDLLKSANSLWQNVKTKVGQGRLTDAQAKATDLVNFGLKNFYAGKLIGRMSPATADNLIALNDAVYAFAGLTDAPHIPPGALSADGAAALLGPSSPTTLVITGTKQAGVVVPAGAAGTITLVSINRLPDSPGPLLTSLDQFPLFYEFTTSPEITFSKNVTTGVCQTQTFDPAIFSQLRLAHNVGPNFGDIEILPRVAAPFLDCSNVFQIGSLEEQGLTGFASAGWRLLDRTVGPVAKAIFLPDELHAAVLGTCCLGGSGTRFSPHGAVDPGSNPGNLGFNPDAATYTNLSAPAGGAVTPAPSVIVRSKNGTPIPNVPVLFQVGQEGGTVNGVSQATINTNANGVATVTTWTLGPTPGTYTVSATPPAVARLGTVEPYRPAAAFSPLSLTFTATAQGADGGDIIVINDINMFQNENISSNFYDHANPADNLKFFNNVVSYSNSSPRGSQKGVLFHRGHNSQCSEDTECSSERLSVFHDALVAAGFTVFDENNPAAEVGNIASGVKIVFLMNPRTNYSAAEITTFKTFLAEGGRLFFAGENPGYYIDGFSVENDFLQQMGSSLRASPTAYSACDHAATRQTSTIPASHIASLPVTSGVSILSIPCAARLILSSGDILIADDLDGSPAAAFATINPQGPLLSREKMTTKTAQQPHPHPSVQTDLDGTGRARRGVR